MKIAKDVINFILIVKNNGTDYMNYIESTFVTQKTDFLKFIKGVVDLFFINQTIITDSSFDIIIERFSNVSGHINLFRQLVSNFNISKMHSRITDLFSTVLLPEFKTSQYLSEWNNRISELQNIANYVNL
jgi:hypothetical protein